jgi:glucosyl-dolichyl phosphate glucuronosyltransferase
MKITVILCSYNRSQTLASTLESLAASEMPSSVQWEVLVVDNNSKDETQKVVDGFANRFPGRFRYLLEKQPGKSFALNAGVRASNADILAFTDDDLFVEPTWLQNLTLPLMSGEWSGCGGRTLPANEFSPPDWMSIEDPHNQAGILFASFDRGAEPCELRIAPYGANMAFRKEMFEKYGLFREDLGPSPNGDVPRPNEDTEFGRRLIAGGEHLRYEPLAVVCHPVVQSRITKQYFLSWWFDYGRAEIREKKKRPDVWGIPRRYISISNRVLNIIPLRAYRWLIESDPKRRFFYKCWTWVAAGELVEIWRANK